jgi:hypothetical protein
VREGAKEVGGQELPFKQPKPSKFNPNFLGYHHNSNITTFFISNFPEDVTTDDLWATFSNYWRVGEVYVPSRRDKFNRRFGFARFVEVEDVDWLLEKLEDTWFGLYKLRANLSRFRRGEAKPLVDSTQQEKGIQREITRPARLNHDLSFKDALRVEKEQPTLDRKKSVPGGENHCPIAVVGDTPEVIRVEVCPIALTRLNQSFVGTLKEGLLAINIQVAIDMEGFQNVKATLMGVDKVLLSSSVEDGVSGAIDADRDWWDNKFTVIAKWIPDPKLEGRRIWVRIFGIPPHVWGWNCLQKIVNSFGRLVSMDVNTEKQLRFDVARVEVVVSSWDFFEKLVEIKVEDVTFSIQVVEERFGDVVLGEVKSSESNLYCDGSVEGSERSLVPSTGGVVSDGGSEEDGERWEEGWSEQNSEEPLRSGPCPEGLRCTVPFVGDPVSEVETVKVHLEVAVTEQIEEFGEVEGDVFDVAEGNRLVGNSFLALTWIDGEDLGESLEISKGKEFSAQKGLVESEGSKVSSVEICKEVVGSDF